MATKKKAAAKPAKKASPAKKTVVVKKPAAKSSSSNSKTVKPAPKKTVKAASKSAPVKKAVKKPIKETGSKVNGSVKGSAPLKPIKQEQVKKAQGKVESKSEAKKPEQKKVEPQKAESKKSEARQPEEVTPPAPKKPAAQPKPSKVVIPEMKTKTARKYEPEFTKSVLDQPENIQTGPTMRYSDAELTEFRELIQKKLDQAKKELAYLQGLITRKDEMGGDENENRYMTMEDGSMSMEREQLAQMASRQINYIDHLEKAIIRIENKTYGICRVTGKLIDKARLRAVPHATLSIEAKQTMNK